MYEDKMNKRNRSSRIIKIALTSAGIKKSPKCKQKLNFYDKPVIQPAPAPDPRDGVLIEDLQQARAPDPSHEMLVKDFGQESVNYSAITHQDYGGIVPLASVVQCDGQVGSFTPSPSTDYTLLETCLLNDKVGKEVTTVVNTFNEVGQKEIDLSLVDRAGENLNTNFTHSDLTRTTIDQPSTSTGVVAELMSCDDVPLPNDNPIIDKYNNLTQPSNSMDPDTPKLDTSSTETEVGQKEIDLSLVDRVGENLNTNFTHSDLTRTTIDQPSTSTGVVAELMSCDDVPLPNDNPIIDKYNNLTQPSNSMDPDTPKLDTSSTETEVGQKEIDLSLVDRVGENLNTNFTHSDLTRTTIDQPSTSTGVVAELMSCDDVPLPNDNPIIDKYNYSTQPSNSMDPDKPNLDTSSTKTAGIEVISNGQDNSQNKKKRRKCITKSKYIDYLSDQEDFSTFYGDIDDSDDWSKELNLSDYESDELDSTEKTGKKKKRFRRRKTKTGDLEETVGDSGMRVKKVNVRNERSKKKKAGEEYTTKKGVTVPAKKILPNPCQGKRCGNDCGSIPEERRESIFQHFWKLDLVRRRDWLVSLSQRLSVKRKRSDSEKRSCTIKYFINEGEGKRNVCLQFIAATINVSDRTIYSIVKNAECGSAKEDMRGKSEPANKTKQTTMDAAVDFIKSLPAVPSHYCRQDSSKIYLPEEFKNIPNLYKIYKRHFVDQGVDVVSERIFRKIFDEKFNIGFHVPKKDKCKKCILFEKTTDPDKLQEKQEHIKEKDESYARFQSHKHIHKEDPSTLCVSFDLEKVLNTPYSPSMLLYYSRKLAVYNLCVYENGTRNVFCFFWDESNGKRGANEVATILHKYIKSVDERGNIKRLLMYCDCCPGQNRNRTVMAMIHLTLQECNNIKTIQLNFLLTGHTYMPVDSSHAIIENHLKQTTVYAPSQWFTIFSTARQNPSPFTVERMCYEHFKKWDNIGEKYYKGNLNGKISKVRIATFKKGKQLVSIKTSMNADAKLFNVEVQPKTTVPLMSCYRSLLPISKMKYDDLRKLCTEQIIPACFHHEYLNIPRDGNTKDVLPESDIDDPDYV